MIDFTVAIRTYNGASNLPSLLDHLQTQMKTNGVCWEVLIVDNNSTDSTSEIIQQYQRHWQGEAPLRAVLERKQGAAIARRRAIEEAQGKWVGFIDDDAVPTPTWVQDAFDFAESRPKIGAFSGQIIPEYESEPLPSFDRIAYHMPVMMLPEQFCYRQYPKRGYPEGVGLVIRRDVWLEYVPERQMIQGPVKSGFALKGEEVESLSHIRRTEWEIWYNGKMAVIHRIPTRRLERGYLLNFFRIIGLSQHRFRMLRLKPWERPLFFPLFIANDVRRIVQHYVKYRSVLGTDIAADCEWRLALYRLMSPVYIWSNLLKNREVAPDSGDRHINAT
ncbi:MAG: hormogonium polysaccharide biosynthesis glycosyltransferase HpsE [Plectolyngbya sp. WJT66-NPBG17]|jgi:glycosyltransferase involved in cell wall biosynthesis|nr:hormogonium polysaccharide biosynthesis glycosyltransferase HpsE [Plectolyngbya sp. WJT66-NPBG17]